jgi:hypothetical protein
MFLFSCRAHFHAATSEGFFLSRWFLSVFYNFLDVFQLPCYDFSFLGVFTFTPLSTIFYLGENMRSFPVAFCMFFFCLFLAAGAEAAQKKKVEAPAPALVQLDEKAIRENSLTRLINTIKERNPNATGLENITIDNVTIAQKWPISFGDSTLWMVKLRFSGLPTVQQGDADKVDMVLTVDPTGTYQYAEITDLVSSDSVFAEARREMNNDER